MARCGGETKAHKRCKRQAVLGAEYCAQHMKTRNLRVRAKKVPVRMSQKQKDALPVSAFCGKAAGKINPRTYPVTSKDQALKVLAFSSFAPNPEGLRRCVNRKAKENRWW